MQEKDLFLMSLTALRNLAKESGIKGYSRLQKDELVSKLKESGGSEENPEISTLDLSKEPKTRDDLDSGIVAGGYLDIIPDQGYGFIRMRGDFTPSDKDIYISPSQIRRFELKTGDYITGNIRLRRPEERYSALLYTKEINHIPAEKYKVRENFDKLTPIFPNEHLSLETPGSPLSMRIVDLLAPIGKGQRGLIVAQPKVGKTTLLKQIAASLSKNYPKLHIFIVLIDERPEEVTDMTDTFRNEKNVLVFYSTFDESPEHHRLVTNIVIEHAKRLVEQKQEVVILLDSLTRLTRASNLTCQPSGRTLSGGLDPASLAFPKKVFGAARNMREGGSLTILATVLSETGSRLDDIVYEEFKGTGNMELVLDRSLSEKRIFPAINVLKSSTRRDDLLLTEDELEAVRRIHRFAARERAEEDAEFILDLFASTKNNKEFVEKFKTLSLK